MLSFFFCARAHLGFGNAHDVLLTLYRDPGPVTLLPGEMSALIHPVLSESR